MAALPAGPGARTSRGLVMAHADEPRDGGAPMARGTAGSLAPAGDRPDPAGDRMDEALKVAAVQAEETGGLGRPGRPVNKRSPFFIGMTAAAGAPLEYVRLIGHAVPATIEWSLNPSISSV